MGREAETSRLRIVVVGGGFGGLNAVRGLSRLPVDVTLVDKRNFHLFQPLLYQVATGGLSAGDIAAPLRSVLSSRRNVTVLLDEAVGIDLAAHLVQLKDSPALPYDVAVIAAGAEGNYFGHDEWAPFAPTLKTIEDAIEIRRRIFSAFENAEREPSSDIRREWLRFVIVGGGPTGVELAGAIGEIARDTLRNDFRHIHPEEAEILLVDAGPRILAQMPAELSEKAERSLAELGVRVRSAVKVTCVEATGISLQSASGPQRIASRTVVWAAGVRATTLNCHIAASLCLELDQAGRIPVTDQLTVAGHPEIFVIGDASHSMQDGKPLPGTSPVAIQQGAYVAKIIRARLRSETPPAFHFFDKGTMATIGRKSAVADLGFIRFGGVLAWLAWLFLHLMYLVTFRTRIVVAIQWAFQYFTFNRGARLITAPRNPGNRNLGE